MLKKTSACFVEKDEEQKKDQFERQAVALRKNLRRRKTQQISAVALQDEAFKKEGETACAS